MPGGDFLDTNVFVYLFDDTDERKQGVAQSLIARTLAEDSGCISFQVVQETLHVLTRKFAKRATPAMAVEIFRHSLQPLWKIMPSVELYTAALDLHDRHSFSFYDSLIVAAAQSAGCKRLLTEDLQHGRKIAGLRIENPFL